VCLHKPAAVRQKTHQLNSAKHLIASAIGPKCTTVTTGFGPLGHYEIASRLCCVHRLV
jgi:hypothetical protein